MTLSDLEQSSDHHLHVISHKTPTFGAICIVKFTETRFTHSQRQNEVSSLWQCVVYDARYHCSG